MEPKKGWLINWLICCLLQLPSVTRQRSIVWFITDLLIIGRLCPFTEKMNLKAFAIVLLTTVLLCQNTHSATLRSRKSIVGLAAVGSIQGGQTLSPVQVLDEWCTNLTTHLNTTLEEFVSELYIEDTLWQLWACAIYARVVDESEIERVRAANKWDFYYINNEALSMWYCVYYIHTETFIILAAFLFQISPKCLWRVLNFVLDCSGILGYY